MTGLFHRDPHHTRAHHPERASSGPREVHDTTPDEGAAIIDAALDGAPAVGHLEHTAERPGTVSAGQLTAFPGLAVSVIGGKPAFGVCDRDEGKGRNRHTK